jgi:hypothetical protein
MIGCSRSPTFLAFYGANCAPAIAAGLPQGFGNNDNAGIGGQGAWLSSYEGVLTLNYRIAGNTLTSVTGFTHYDYDNAVDGSNLTVPTLTAKNFGSLPRPVNRSSTWPESISKQETPRRCRA